MVTEENVRKYLAEEYGIRSNEELAEALVKIEPLEIGFMTQPVKK